jgi:hypothetical protein
MSYGTSVTEANRQAGIYAGRILIASTPGGMSRPNSLAVLRLITSSNLVGSITGRSPGFVARPLAARAQQAAGMPVIGPPLAKIRPGLGQRDYRA